MITRETKEDKTNEEVTIYSIKPAFKKGTDDKGKSIGVAQQAYLFFVDKELKSSGWVDANKVVNMPAAIPITGVKARVETLVTERDLKTNLPTKGFTQVLTFLQEDTRIYKSPVDYAKSMLGI